MKKICAWCNKDLGEVPSGPDANPITHGICPDCAREVLSFKAEPLARFLDRFPGPIYVVNGELEVISANGEGAGVLGKSLDDFAGKLPGDAFDCKYDQEPGGCGRTEHCRTCTIRNTLTATLETGESHNDVPAYPDLLSVTEEKKLKFLISTEKLGFGVVLKIEEISEEEKGEERSRLSLAHKNPCRSG
ncbi:MAG: hypothetical protein ABFQ82_03790 [Thermodesulfobacteriota bacterium]